jgi:glycosyltransferase involved in cell wall biosynthesis
MRVLLEAPILTKSGYGEHARLVFAALKQKSELDIFINPLKWGSCSWEIPNEEVHDCIKKFKIYQAHCNQTKQKQEYSLQIHVGIPNEFEKKAPYSICVTAGIETDRVSLNWLVKTHQGIDKIIVPSEHARKGFVQTGYEVLNNQNNTKTTVSCGSPIDVIHYPIKSLNGPKLNIDFDTEFNFLQIAMIGARKNIEQSVKCFVEEFRDNDNVGLVLKTSTSKSSIIDRLRTKNQLERYIKSLGEKKCKIYLIHGNLTESEIHSLYTHPKMKAYYTTTHGEGYGLPIFEAAYSGLPVIATDWSGHLDFLSGTHKGKSKKLFARIAYDLKEVQEAAIWGDLIIKESRWAFPTDVSIRSQLSKVYKDHGMYNSWAKSLKESLMKSHKLENILDQYITSIFGKKTEEEKKWDEDLNEVEVC